MLREIKEGRPWTNFISVKSPSNKYICQKYIIFSLEEILDIFFELWNDAHEHLKALGHKCVAVTYTITSWKW
jgi:hypothetical protein